MTKQNLKKWLSKRLKVEEDEDDRNDQENSRNN
jgi:hypothetical protein